MKSKKNVIAVKRRGPNKLDQEENFVEEQEKIPDGALGAVKGFYYKVGAHGFLYFWAEKWRRSVNDAEMFHKAMDRAKETKTSPFNLHNGGF